MVSIALLVKADTARLTALMSLPLLVGGVCIVTSIIGTYMVRLRVPSGSIMGALYKGLWTTIILCGPAIYFATHYALGDMNAVVGGAGFLAPASDSLTTETTLGSAAS